MSFLKKFVEKITPPKVTLSLNFSGNVFFLGEEVKGDLIVSSEDDFDADEVRCEMQCIESAKVQKLVYNPSLKRSIPVEVWESATLYSTKPAPRHLP
ncbi:MAG: hypothetical protein LZ159_04075 [Thaumarchaeota archaeon]|jgi:hypothetical protein|nr:hypothetical protein [Candidatus Terraquivivens yellowstonensis]